MALTVDALTFDCADAIGQARFWAAALGFEMDPEPEPDFAQITDPSGATGGIDFQTVPEPKVAKNRMHLDLRPTGSMRAEVERLQGLGATVRGFIEEGGSFWTQMYDPEGNEFCVLRGPEDGWTPDE